MIPLLTPGWPAPATVRAAVTLRTGGCSEDRYKSLNLGDQVGDRDSCVQQNRSLVAQITGQSPSAFGWIRQVHGTDLVTLPTSADRQADASTTTEPGQVCCILTADCLPVLFCDRAGTRVAAAHAGWRGLAGGVLEEALRAFPDKTQVLAWLGPAIGPQAFEVGPEVREMFLGTDPVAGTAFQPASSRPGYYFADLYALARRRLEHTGVTAIYGGGECTFSNPDRYFSFRRDGHTGRMASLIWLQ